MPISRAHYNTGAIRVVTSRNEMIIFKPFAPNYPSLLASRPSMSAGALNTDPCEVQEMSRVTSASALCSVMFVQIFPVPLSCCVNHTYSL